MTNLNRDSVIETGLGAANLTIQGGRDKFFSISPSLETSHDIKFDYGTKLRAFADLGVTYFTNKKHCLGASFANAPVGVGAFTVTTQLNRLLWDAEFGATLFSKFGNNLTAKYQSQFLSTQKATALSLRPALSSDVRKTHETKR